MEEKKKDLYLVGDVHGKYRELVWKITGRYDIHDADVLVLGDFGVGFDQNLKREYPWSERRLKRNNVTIWAMRGNHDDPKYFTEEPIYNFPNLKFLVDWKRYKFGENREILVIGGACSIDKEYRIENIDWWEGEDVTRVPDLPGKADIIISHEAPITFDPMPTRPDGLGKDQYGNILRSREYLQEVLESARPDYWFYGHYHKSYSGSWNSTVYRCLAELEFWQVQGGPISHSPQGICSD